MSDYDLVGEVRDGRVTLAVDAFAALLRAERLVDKKRVALTQALAGLNRAEVEAYAEQTDALDDTRSTP